MHHSREAVDHVLRYCTAPILAFSYVPNFIHALFIYCVNVEFYPSAWGLNDLLRLYCEADL